MSQPIYKHYKTACRHFGSPVAVFDHRVSRVQAGQSANAWMDGIALSRLPHDRWCQFVPMSGGQPSQNFPRYFGVLDTPAGWATICFLGPMHMRDGAPVINLFGNKQAALDDYAETVERYTHDPKWMPAELAKQ